MQRLEVSGAVRPIYGSLGVKRLTALFLSLFNCELLKQIGNIQTQRLRYARRLQSK